MLKVLQVILTLFLIQSKCQNNSSREKKILNFEKTTIIYPETIASIFFQQYNSYNPIFLVVDRTPIAYENAWSFYQNLRKKYVATDKMNFILLEYDGNTVSEILESTLNNRTRFEEILQQRIESEPSSIIGNLFNNASAAFSSILKASQFADANDGIVLFLARPPIDDTLGQLALQDLQKKKLRLYVVSNIPDSRNAILEELAIKSGGNFYKADKKLSQKYYEYFLNNLENYSTVSTILSRKNLSNQKTLYFPIDSNVAGIHINISPNVTVGVLKTPSGEIIDILDSEAVTKFSFGSFAKTNFGLHEVHLNIRKNFTVLKDIGVWRLVVNNVGSYNVDVFAHTKLTTNAFITYTNSTDNFLLKSHVMNVQVRGDSSKITNITFVTKSGKPITEIGNYTWNLAKKSNNKLEKIKNGVEKQIDINLDKIPNEPFYAVVNGQDSQGHDFTRLSYVSQNIINEFFNVPALTIDVGLGSELITEPNRRPEILFEVTNNHYQASLVRFQVKDDQSMLTRLDPLYKWISPQETATVRVTLATRAGVSSDTVTLTGYGASTISKKVRVDVGSSGFINDHEAPTLDYKFLSDCTENYGSCYDRVWAVEIRSTDTSSGLLQISTEPKGLYFSNEFVSGTRQEVKGYYWQSCCQSRLEISTIDRRNNRYVKTINGYWAPLRPGAIAAIVLGILLLILLIVLIVYICRNPPGANKKASYDLPTYRRPTGSKI